MLFRIKIDIYKYIHLLNYVAQKCIFIAKI